MKLSQTTGLIFLVGVLISGLGVFQISSIPSQRQKIGVAEGGLLALRQKSEKLSGILSEIKTIGSNLEVVRGALPAADDVPALIMQLEQISKTSGVTVQHLGFGEGKAVVEKAEEGAGVRKISVTVVVTGSYASLQTFLRNLEGASRVVNVTNFRFSPAQQKEGEEAVLSVTLGVEAFYLAEVQDVSPETPLTLDTTSKDYVDLIRKVKSLRVYKTEVSE